MPEVVDDRGVRVRLVGPPQRIVSLVPSATETLFDLGVGPQVVGVTRFCVHPEDGIAGLPRVGGTKDVDPARVAALRPDLVVANCEENTRGILDALADVAPVYAAFPRDLDGALRDLLRLGELLGRTEAAGAWHRRIAEGRAALAPTRRLRVAFLVWRRPWMAINRDTFAHHLLAEAGLDSVTAHRTERYPEVTAEELAAADPDLVLLPTEPFPFRHRHAVELAEATGIPFARFRRVDGEACTWHGTRLARSLPALAAARDRGFDPLEDAP